jgi:hypothetical protein
MKLLGFYLQRVSFFLIQAQNIVTEFEIRACPVSVSLSFTIFCRRGRATNLGRVPKLGRCDIFMKEVQPLRDKHDKLFFTGELIKPAIGVAVRS